MTNAIMTDEEVVIYVEPPYPLYSEVDNLKFCIASKDRKVPAHEVSWNVLAKAVLGQAATIQDRDATIKAQAEELERLRISDDDAKEVRQMLDQIDVWDAFDRAVDRMLSLFANDPLNQALANKEPS